MLADKNHFQKGAVSGTLLIGMNVFDSRKLPIEQQIHVREHFDRAKKEVVAARYHDIPADALEAVAKNQGV
jgi:hypothetical protein